jgi:hypothetical protein
MGSFYSNWDKKDTKNTKKQMSVKNATVLIKAPKKKKPNFEKAVSRQLPISLIVNRRLTANRKPLGG